MFGEMHADPTICTVRDGRRSVGVSAQTRADLRYARVGTRA
jgi:hypothetical protein